MSKRDNNMTPDKEKVWNALTLPEGMIRFSADDGDHMPVSTFLEYVLSGGFIDDDGFGEWATETHYLPGKWIHPSDMMNNRKPIPSWATHVMWYNK